jgi:hypothetical protein
MKVVHAIWEQRNLGVDCIEITVEQIDSSDDLLRVLTEQEADYIVVRCPVARMDLLLIAQQLGYRFSETMTYCYHNGEGFNLSSIQQRIVDRISWEPMKAKGFDLLFEQIGMGMFTQDRVSLDPRFSPALVRQRYTHWIRDEFARGGSVFQMSYSGREFGFFSLKPTGSGEVFAFLSGVYAEFRNSGFGFCCHYCEVVEAIRSGARRVMTSYSSNNRGATAVHLSMGHVLHQQVYILVKHGPNKGAEH